MAHPKPARARSARKPPAEPTASRLSGDQRREQLIDVAAELFSCKGFSGTTTREIAVLAGVTEALIFRHFQTKEQLYTAIIDRCLKSPSAAEWMLQLRVSMERDDDEAVIRQLIDGIIKTHKIDPKFERLMLYAALEGNRAALSHIRQVTADMVDAFKTYFKRREEQGALREVGPDAALMAIVGMAQHYARSRYVHELEGNCMSDEQAVERFTAVALHGLCASHAVMKS